MPQPLKYIIGFLVPVMAFFYMLFFGPVQWKYCYMIQIYVNNSYKTNTVFDPNGKYIGPLDWIRNPITYLPLQPNIKNGTWNHWNNKGELEAVFILREGLPVEIKFPTHAKSFYVGFDSHSFPLYTEGHQTDIKKVDKWLIARRNGLDLDEINLD